MSDLELFKLPDKKNKPEKFCRDCQNRFCQVYGAGKRFWYCTERKSNYTYQGYLKIKLKNEACLSFKQKAKDTVFQECWME